MAQNCCHKRKVSFSNKKSGIWSWFGALIIALLPKCPYCIMAFSGAVGLCSGQKIFSGSPEIGTYFSMGIAFFTLCAVGFNYKGWKTIWSVMFVILGMVCIFLTEYIIGSATLYTIGSILIIGGVWWNGSLPHFYFKILKWLSIPEKILLIKKCNSINNL